MYKFESKFRILIGELCCLYFSIDNSYSGGVRMIEKVAIMSIICLTSLTAYSIKKIVEFKMKMNNK